MKTITLKEHKMTFHEALMYLKEGKCIGIRPSDNADYLVKYRPKWMNPDSTDFMLKWRSSIDEEVGIRSNQYSEDWFPVIMEMNDNIINEAIEYVRSTSVENNGYPSLLHGNVAGLIKILTGKEIDGNLLKPIKK